MSDVIDKTDKGFWRKEETVEELVESFADMLEGFEEVLLDFSIEYNSSVETLLHELRRILPELDNDTMDIISGYTNEAYLLGRSEGELSSMQNASLLPDNDKDEEE